MNPSSPKPIHSLSHEQLVNIAQALAPFAKIGVQLLAPGDSDDAPLIELNDGCNPPWVLTKGDFKAATRAALLLDSAMQVPEAPIATLICKKCGADRFKEDCRGPRLDCGIRFEAQQVISERTDHPKAPQRVQDLRKQVRNISRATKGQKSND